MPIGNLVEFEGAQDNNVIFVDHSFMIILAVTIFRYPITEIFYQFNNYNILIQASCFVKALVEIEYKWINFHI